ncbi:hypothetical protein DFS34DRAFT_646511 [Phlyctochytrium arcticum]|nr:hypothetical protein DFS34DRAFT_646511 [Phlyctochytrium arcticum]
MVMDVGIVTASGMNPAILLSRLDYPEEYLTPGKMFAHPNDYEITTEPIEPDVFYYARYSHRRIFARLPVALGNDKWTSATFIVDTGAGGWFYLSEPLLNILDDYQRVKDDDLGGIFIEVDIGGTGTPQKCPCDEVPRQYIQGNIIGLPVLLMAGFSIKKTPKCELDDKFIARGVVELGLKMVFEKNFCLLRVTTGRNCAATLSPPWDEDPLFEIVQVAI